MPIFPLPDVVFFPKTVLPLHVFEPRYRRLVNDVLGGDRRFAVVLLKPGQAPEEQRAAPFDVGCLGEIVRADALPDGRFNLLLAGIVRIRIREFVTEVPYRVVGAALQPDEGADRLEPAAEAFRHLVQRYFRAVLRRPTGPELREQELDCLVNTAAANLRGEALERQRLLETGSLPERMRSVAERMREQLETHRVLRLAADTRPADPRVN
ncbi:MAG: LON peptidase substrate-binding domain-containing protein [Gemmatimonadota bacterium]